MKREEFIRLRVGEKICHTGNSNVYEIDSEWQNPDEVANELKNTDALMATNVRTGEQCELQLLSYFMYDKVSENSTFAVRLIMLEYNQKKIAKHIGLEL